MATFLNYFGYACVLMAGAFACWLLYVFVLQGEPKMAGSVVNSVHYGADEVDEFHACYMRLVAACLGDLRAATDLWRYEKRMKPELSDAEAVEYALERLERDRRA